MKSGIRAAAALFTPRQLVASPAVATSSRVAASTRVAAASSVAAKVGTGSTSAGLSAVKRVGERRVFGRRLIRRAVGPVARTTGSIECGG